MNNRAERLQWEMCVQVIHGPQFGHRFQLAWGRPQYDSVCKRIGFWSGVGVPEPVLNGARASIDALFTDHVVTRYGILGELPLKWGGEPDPF